MGTSFSFFLFFSSVPFSPVIIVASPTSSSAAQNDEDLNLVLDIFDWSYLTWISGCAVPDDGTGSGSVMYQPVRNLRTFYVQRRLQTPA